MSTFYRNKKWSEPYLIIPSTLWEDLKIGSGFLTPTPINLPDGNVRVFGGVRDELGRSSIHWADLDIFSEKVLDYSRIPCLDTRESQDFDTDGAILGDIFAYKDALGMFYIGFKLDHEVKFRAYTGFAISNDFGLTWTKSTSPITSLEANVESNDIFAVHSVNISPDSIELLIAIGDSWEVIDGVKYPKYSSYRAHGNTFEDLILESIPLLPQSQNIYRLGRPRFFFDSNKEIEFILATGGRRDGDYRPYIFEKKNGSWDNSHLEFPVLPGEDSRFSLQVSYPSQIHVQNSNWIFFNGDQMGRTGCYFMRSSNEII
jgi:hypothetical protein